MKPRPILLGGSGAAAALLLLALTWLLTSPGGAVAGEPNALTPAHSISAPSVPTPDPRWLALIHSPLPGSLLSLQASAPSININLTDRFVAGRVALASPVAISVTRAGSRVAHAIVTPIPDDGGFFYLAHLTWAGAEYGSGGACGGGVFQPGDVIWVAQAGTTATMTVPTLSGLADAPTDVISGSAPPTQPVTLYLFLFADPAATYTRTVTANEAGMYQALWAPEVDLRPGDSGYVAYTESANRRAYARFVTPFLRVQVAGRDISGMAAPCSEVEVTVYDSEGAAQVVWWTSTGPDGRFYTWEYSTKEVFVLRPGDRVVAMAAGQTFSTTVLSVTAHTDLTGGQVRGEAPAGAPVSVMQFAGPLSYGWDDLWSQLPTSQALVTATASGLYTASLPLARTDYGAACAFSPAGHQTCARFAVPYLRVRMGESRTRGYLLGYEAWGQVDAPSAPITIALQSARGYLKDIRRLTAAGNGYFRDALRYEESLTLNTGDIVTVTTPRGIQAALALPLLTAEANPLSDTVAGQAPPGTRLVVAILYDVYPIPPPPGALGGGPAPPPPPYYGYAVRVVTATAEGRYVADFSGEVNITNATVGEVSMNTPEGHTIARAFHATTGCRPVLTCVQVGGNFLEGLSDYGCPTLTLRLYDVQGYPKAVRQFDFSQSPYFATYLYESEAYPYWKSRPIPIQTGDRIELTWADQAITTTVPTLTVALDPLADVISGQAPPGVLLYLKLYDHGLLTTTVGGQGTYSVPLAGKYNLVPGNLVHGAYVQDGMTFFALGAVPTLRTGLYQNWISGLLSPIESYTIVLEATVPATATGYAGPDGWWGKELEVRLKPSDTITLIAPNLSIRLPLPFLSAWVDRAAATVSGEAPANARLRVDLTTWQYTYRSREVTATAAGTYTVSFPDLAPLAGIQGTLTYFNPEGNQVYLSFANRQWHVTLGQPCVWGYADMVGVPFTVTLQAENAPPESTFSGTSDEGGYFDGCFSRAVQPGDRLTLVQPGATMSFTVPVLSARHQYAQQVLEGEAPSGTFLELVFHTSSGSVVRHTQADPFGHYALDTAELDLRPGQTGYVAMTDEEGNIIQTEFTIVGYPVYLPLICR